MNTFGVLLGEKNCSSNEHQNHKFGKSVSLSEQIYRLQLYRHSLHKDILQGFFKQKVVIKFISYASRICTIFCIVYFITTGACRENNRTII
jgi:hypothetical protein